MPTREASKLSCHIETSALLHRRRPLARNCKQSTLEAAAETALSQITIGSELNQLIAALSERYSPWGMGAQAQSIDVNVTATEIYVSVSGLTTCRGGQEFEDTI